MAVVVVLLASIIATTVAVEFKADAMFDMATISSR
jgi:hypothetical protein